MLFVAVCWCRINRYKPPKWSFFRILHHNRVQNIIQCHDNNIWKQMCIKELSYSTETYLQYNLQRKINRSKNTCELHITNWSYSYKLGIVFTMYERITSKDTSWAGPRLQESGHRAAFKCCIYKDSLWLVRYCFVKDSSIIQIPPLTSTPTSETVNLSQTGLDLFSGASQTTGGQVSVRKTKWYHLEFKWDSQGQWRLAENPSDLFLNTPKIPQKIKDFPHHKPLES